MNKLMLIIITIGIIVFGYLVIQDNNRQDINTLLNEDRQQEQVASFSDDENSDSQNTDDLSSDVISTPENIKEENLLTTNTCFNPGVGADAYEACNAKPGCAAGFFDQIDPRDGTHYIKTGCDTVSEWEKFYTETPSIDELMSVQCRQGQKNESECTALSHCVFMQEYNMCIDA